MTRSRFPAAPGAGRAGGRLRASSPCPPASAGAPAPPDRQPGTRRERPVTRQRLPPHHPHRPHGSGPRQAAPRLHRTPQPHAPEPSPRPPPPGAAACTQGQRCPAPALPGAPSTPPSVLRGRSARLLLPWPRQPCLSLESARHSRVQPRGLSAHAHAHAKNTGRVGPGSTPYLGHASGEAAPPAGPWAAAVSQHCRRPPRGRFHLLTQVPQARGGTPRLSRELPAKAS